VEVNFTNMKGTSTEDGSRSILLGDTHVRKKISSDCSIAVEELKRDISINAGMKKGEVHEMLRITILFCKVRGGVGRKDSGCNSGRMRFQDKYGARKKLSPIRRRGRGHAGRLWVQVCLHKENPRQAHP